MKEHQHNVSENDNEESKSQQLNKLLLDEKASDLRETSEALQFLEAPNDDEAANVKTS